MVDEQGGQKGCKNRVQKQGAETGGVGRGQRLLQEDNHRSG